MIRSEYVKARALAAGFHACGIARAEALPGYGQALDTWLAHGFNADMQYMERHADKRRDPRLLYPGARTVISVLLAYKPSRTIDSPHKIARYAYNEDYHRRIKRMLFELTDDLQKRYPDFKARPFVDTAPISDKQWAAAAGLGWIGRNTLLVNQQYGSFCNIGELVSDSEADVYDQPVENRCGECRLCVQSCPNQALSCVDGRYMLNAARCTAYNTIENRQEDLRGGLHSGGYVFGCDICQEACPHNRHTAAATDPGDEQLGRLQQLATADEKQFAEATRNTPISRISHRQWLRNLKQD